MRLYEKNKEVSFKHNSMLSTQPTQANIKTDAAQQIESPLNSIDEKYTPSQVQRDVHSDIITSQFEVTVNKQSYCESEQSSNMGTGVYDYPSDHKTNIKFIGRIDNSGNRQGYGVMIYKNGQNYTGFWSNDKKEGLGVYNFNGEHYLYEKYEGNFIDNKFSGEGKLTYIDQSIYSGGLKNNQKNGKGLMTYSPDDDLYISYKGDWKEDCKQGHGTLKYRDGSVYKGDFEDGFVHGSGKMSWDRNSKDKIFSVYEGQFFKGGMCGTGKMRYQNDDTYVGIWENNVFDGFGEYKCSTKSSVNCLELPNEFIRIEGNFQNGLMNGICKVFLKNGNIIIADYKFEKNKELLDFNESTYMGIIYYSEIEKSKFKQKNIATYQGEIKGFQAHGMGALYEKNKSKKCLKGKFSEGDFDKNIPTLKDNTDYDEQKKSFNKQSRKNSMLLGDKKVKGSQNKCKFKFFFCF